MKKIILLGVILLSSINLSAQETKFGVTAGYINLTATSSYEGVSGSVNEPGFYIGALADIVLNESFHLKPGINYAFISDSGILSIPIMAQYYIATSGFHLQAGPQVSILMEETGDEVNALGFDLGFGAGYDINENFFIEARYALELTNRLTDEGQSYFGADVTSRFNSLNVGVGYKF